MIFLVNYFEYTVYLKKKKKNGKYNFKAHVCKRILHFLMSFKTFYWMCH